MNVRPLMKLKVTLADPQALGTSANGTRVIVPISGGSFKGDRLQGTVLEGGDWTLLRPDGVLELDLRLTLRTEDGALIQLSSLGLRHGPPEVLAALARGEAVDPDQYYFRTMPRFETAAKQYAFLNRILAVSTGDRRPGGPIYTIDEVL